jgi:hypothetical protein
MQFKSIIENWFKNETGGSLFLPDGWYGRPYDNQHLLTYINETDDELTITLDGKLTLHFIGLRKVEAQKGELILNDFNTLRFDWETYGKNSKRGTKQYTEGPVKILVGA